MSIQVAGRALVVVLVAAAAMGGCNKTGGMAEGDGQAAHGRFAGVGVTEAGPHWSRAIVANRPANDPGAAKTALDDHVIVMVDTRTGEIRQCGDVSGYCIGEKTLDPLAQTRAVDVSKVPSIEAHDPAASDAAAASE